MKKKPVRVLAAAIVAALVLSSAACAGEKTDTGLSDAASESTQSLSGQDTSGQDGQTDAGAKTGGDSASDVLSNGGADAGITGNSEGSADSDKADTSEAAADMSQNEPALELTQAYKGYEDTNPIFTQHFGADPYAMEYEGRVYFFMTADAFEYNAAGEITENTYSKIKSIYCVSTDDMVNFTDHGEIRVAGSAGAARWANNSWAPAAAWKMVDGKPKFFLYFADNGSGIGVLTSDSPTGPFEDPIGKQLVSHATPNCGNVIWLFDPAVLVDDDGRAYLYFGGGVPEGQAADPGTGRVIELGEDMISVKGEAQVLDVPYLFEDSGIHKFGDKYYYTYCTNWSVDSAGTKKYGFSNAQIVSLVSDNPMGPFEFNEIILSNPGVRFGLAGNNHHCVFTFNGKGYITYHARALEKAMGVEQNYRATHIEEFDFAEDGTIGRIPMTYKGRTQLKYVDPTVQHDGVTVAQMAGTQASLYKGNMVASGFDRGDFTEIQGVDFAELSLTKVVVSTLGDEGTFRFCIDDPSNEPFAVVNVSEAKDYTEFEGEVLTQVNGVHNLFIVCENGEELRFNGWRFE